MSEEQTITIEVDGETIETAPGRMLIEVTDAAGIAVPRFCYHKKLSIAANCRMCLVEVEGAPKPLPACATPINDGMKIFTRSPLAREAQKGTMEFLLINHPLDCPICDQGGECELQDVAMGYGGDVSRFAERKRVVKDQNIGALIATDMTRCIHCTRCVRFGGEIAGLRELGASGRGEHMKIGLFVEQSVASELSGNVIDLCPVGALTSKPYRFSARSWELTQHETISAHDGLGSNVHAHIRRNRIMRVVPRDNEAVNETWISDRDRFSYEGLYSEDRLTTPMIRDNGQLREADWQEALQAAAKLLKDTPAGGLGTLISPGSTLEELYLTQALSRGLGSNHIDHRLRQSDFRQPGSDPDLPWLGLSFADLESVDSALLVGSWLRKDLPLLNHRLRKAFKEGAAVCAINPIDFGLNYELDVNVVASPTAMVKELAGVAKALGADTLGIKVKADEAHRAIADLLKQGEQGVVLLGSVAHAHPDFTLLRALAANIAAASGATLGYVPDGANSVGAWAAGAVPHRTVGGSETTESGLDALGMLADRRDSYLLVNVEPEYDLADPSAAAVALDDAKLVAIVSHHSPLLEAQADVLLPMAGFGESSGTLINLQNDRQSFTGCVPPLGDARPGWKILRVLGNLVDLDGFDFVSSEEVRDRALSEAEGLAPNNAPRQSGASAPQLLRNGAFERVGGVPMYSADAICRRAHALQHTPDAWGGGLRLHPSDAGTLAIDEGESARVSQGETSVTLPVRLDQRVPSGCVWLPSAVPGSEVLGLGFGSISVEKA